MKDSVIAQHVRARDHIILERLDMAKQYSTLLANSDKHQFYRIHIAACGRVFQWNLLTDPKAAALRTAIYGDDSTIDNGYISHDDILRESIQRRDLVEAVGRDPVVLVRFC